MVIYDFYLQTIRYITLMLIEIARYFVLLV